MMLNDTGNEPIQTMLDFKGAGYEEARDGKRLRAQYHRIFHLMKDGKERTLSGIASITGDPEASISAMLRCFRRESFGSHTVNRRYLGNGLHGYTLILNPKALVK